jgi:DCN1-like protein 4/5
MSTKKRGRQPPAKANKTAGRANAKRTKLEQLEDFYNTYKEAMMLESTTQEEEDAIGPSGIFKLCQDLSLEPDSLPVLVLAWHFAAQKQGFFTRKEFLNGLMKLECYNLEQLKKKLRELEREALSDPSRFAQLYRFAFEFSKESEVTKVVDLQLAAEMLNLVMKGMPHGDDFVSFLKSDAHTYKVLNLDQWMCFLDFSRSVAPNFSNFDEDSAWPLILDEFAAWSRKRMQMVEK